MDFQSKIIKTKFIHELDDSEYYPEIKCLDSLQTTISDSRFSSSSSSSTPSPKKSCRRSIQKRVITVPINDGDGARLKGEMGAPPSDSWSWRKYGQKPIKGSPFPRGYYRCSSSKGCPARKQVEKSREDPNTLVVAYYCDHNHPFPPPRKINNHQNQYDHEKVDHEEQQQEEEAINHHVISQSKHYNMDTKKFSNNNNGIDELSEHNVTGRDKKNNIGVKSNGYNESWFCDYDDDTTTCSTLLEVPFFNFEEEENVSSYGDHNMSMVYTMRSHEDDDEAIFADLGELPECSAVFHRRKTEIIEDERRRQTFKPCYGYGTT